MPLETIIQSFLITAFFVILVIVAKLYYKFTQKFSFTRDSFFLSLMATSVLMIPVFLNPDSRLYCLSHPSLTIIFLLLSIISLSLIYYFLCRAVFLKEHFLDTILCIFFKIPDIKLCESIIKEKVPKTKAYSVEEISKLIKMDSVTIEKAFNKLALEKKARISVLETGQLQYLLQ